MCLPNSVIRGGFLSIIVEGELYGCLQDVIEDLGVKSSLGIGTEDFYLLHNGKIISRNDVVTSGVVHVVPRQRGGKGGFGSMLRAIGAQIEKTTNREACRDLSGRRLRDINEEKRLKNWIAQQADREREAAERRKKKLERLCAEPRHEFKDQGYEQERSELAENVSAAVEQGFKATSSGVIKRKSSSQTIAPKKKKPCLWLDADADLSSGNSDESVESDEEKTASSQNLHPGSLADNADIAHSSKQVECILPASSMVEESAIIDSDASSSSSAKNESSVKCEQASSSYNEVKPVESNPCSS